MKYHLTFLLLFIGASLKAQTYKPDLQEVKSWQVVNRKTESVQDKDKKAVRLNEMPGEGMLWLNDYTFSTGTIEFDVKGKNVLQQSFVGIAFHGQDEKAYDAIYFRPFNFVNPDTARRSRAVQYVSMPGFPWEKLRVEFPGKYENKVRPVPDPDDWFHAKVQVEEKTIKVFVNGAAEPSLQVEKLTGSQSGKIGLWVGNNSGGSFANLEVTSAKAGEKIPYGNNPKVGKYCNVGDAKLYYEVYGSGKPLVLLHGGVYGYISEFEPFIPKLTQKYQVICIATRGHGKSEIGSTPYTWKQRAEDAYKVIRSITRDSVIVVGFSDGAFAGYKLAATHPEMVKKLIAIGAGDVPKGSRKEQATYSPEMLLGQAKDLFEARLALMPEPKRWGESLSWLNKLYNEDYLSRETFERIKCPVLVMSGDKDSYHTVENVTRASKMIAKSQLSIIQNCPHVVFFCNFPAVWESTTAFLAK